MNWFIVIGATLVLLIVAFLYWLHRDKQAYLAERVREEEEEERQRALAKKERWEHFLKYPPIVEHRGGERYLKVLWYRYHTPRWFKVVDGFIKTFKITAGLDAEDLKTMAVESILSDKELICLVLKEYEPEIYSRLVDEKIIEDDDLVEKLWDLRAKYTILDEFPAAE